MVYEIERKFLVDKALWEEVKESCEEKKDIEQYYLMNGQGFVLRLSVVNFKLASLGIKGGKKGITSVDLSYKIEMVGVIPLIESVPHTKIHKTRYMYPYRGFMWEIDVFHDHNEGLIVAEIELPSEGTVFEKPDFILQEVSYTKGYSNFELSKPRAMNQCDGCNCQVPVKDGVHWMPYPSGPIVCTKKLYEENKTQADDKDKQE